MKYQLRNILFAVRLAVILFFVLFSLNLPTEDKASLLVLSAVYLSLTLYSFLFSLPSKPVNRFIDVIFVPIMILITRSQIALYTLIPFVIIFTPRYYPSSIILTIGGFILSIYIHLPNILNILPDMFILIASFIASSSPDFIEKMRKELKSINALKKTADRLSQEYAKWEITKRELANTDTLINLSIKHANLKGFFKELIEKFDISSVSIVPTKEDKLIVKKDEENKTYTVPVKLYKGNALVIFEMKHKYQLWDQGLLNTLDRAANMLNIYIEGFPEDAIYRNIKINVS